jgi:magnesium transporter
MIFSLPALRGGGPRSPAPNLKQVSCALNGTNKSFIFLSDIIGLPVVDAATARKVGRVLDVVAALGEMYPRVLALIVRPIDSRQPVRAAWAHVARLDVGERISITVGPDTFQANFRIPDTEILLKESFWDKQIVDLQGAKVVRVNDLHLLIEGLRIWVAHMDVGTTGLLRRMGCLRLVNSFARLVSSCELKDHFISWKFVQPMTPKNGSAALSLKVRHSQLTELAPGDLADILAELGADERIAVFRSLGAAAAADALQALPLKIRLQIAEAMDPTDLPGIVQEMADTEVANLIAELSRKRVKSVLGGLPQDRAAQIANLLGQSEQTAQRIMRTDFLSTSPAASAAAVLDQIRKEHGHREFTPYTYVLGEGNVLAGVVSLHQLLTAPPDKVIAEFMRKRLTKVTPLTHVRAVARLFGKNEFTVIPVVDKQNRMLGIITIKDALAAAFPEIREGVSR